MQKVLFVDDESDFEWLIRQKYRNLLRSGEVVFEFAGNGREALQRIREESFCLVMTDINMPEMDGLTLLDEINKLSLDLPVVIISAYGDMENIRTAMNRGAFDFLTKPIDFEDMEITRKKAIRLYEERRRLEEQNQFMRETFGRYLNDTVVQILLDSPGGLQLGGAMRNVTILMTDLRGFCSLTERYPPETIVATLNYYLSAMIEVVVEHGGMIDELVGDGILAVFGAPLAQDDHVQRAVSCAVAMQLAMESVNRHNEYQGWPLLEMGIGIDTGEAIVGNIGSKRRAKYGVVGNHVNLAGRIESCTVGGQILVSESIVQQCRSLLVLGDEMDFCAKGFEQPVRIYEVLGVRGERNLDLPRTTDDLIVLTESIPLHCCRLRQYSPKDVYEACELVKLSSRGCELATSQPLEPLDNIKLRVLDKGGGVVVGGIYAKVVSREPEQGKRFGVRFTSMSPEAERFLENTLYEISRQAATT
jgi:class 3 adenylate cyclase